MIPYNPCGRIVEWGHHRYRTKCRFFRDSDREDEIEWYPAPEGAECIPFPCRIYQTIWDRDPDEIIEYHEGVGEVWDSKHVTTHMKPVPGTGKGHFCGTEEMFDQGAEFDPDFHVDYKQGLPVCCGVEELGGIEWGGEAQLINPSSGGIDWAGNAVQGYDIVYNLSVPVGFGLILFRELIPVVQEKWTDPFGFGTMRGPTETGVAHYWTVTFSGVSPSFPFSVWERSGWDGFGEVEFTRIVGDGPPSRVWVARNDLH